MRILVVEDSARLAESLRNGLRRLGHAVDVVHDGESGLSYAKTNPYDVVLLDLLLPRIDGLTVLRRLREHGADTSVLILTAKDTVDDRVRGLRQGADDYLVKPFSFDELVARIEALGRRRAEAKRPSLRVGDLVIDLTARRVERAGVEIPLTAREFALLRFLATRRGEIVSATEIEDHLYDEATFPVSNAVQSAISALRKRLKAAGDGELIHTRRGLGYVLEADPA